MLGGPDADMLLHLDIIAITIFDRSSFLDTSRYLNVESTFSKSFNITTIIYRIYDVEVGTKNTGTIRNAADIDVFYQDIDWSDRKD